MQLTKITRRLIVFLVGISLAVAAGVAFVSAGISRDQNRVMAKPALREAGAATYDFKPAKKLDYGGFSMMLNSVSAPRDPRSLTSVRDSFVDLGRADLARLKTALADRSAPVGQRIANLTNSASVLLYLGEANQAYDAITEARELAEANPQIAADLLYSLIYFQGVAAMRRGENDNCVNCLGEGACVLPIAPSAIHKNTAGSKLAVKHFKEYLNAFPQAEGARWLLNLAAMTLGQRQKLVPSEFAVDIERFGRADDIGRFRDIGDKVGVRRFNMAGGAVMDDFDNDGLLDLAVSDWDNTAPMSYWRNKGDGTFEDRTAAAKLTEQYGGLNLSQTDFDNDGRLDLFISRGAWMPHPMRPSLLRNNPDGTFTDVTAAAGLLEGANSNCAAWADFDNDGWLDVFVCNETGPNRLYRNRHDGTFEEIAAKARVRGTGEYCKGACWIDYDNDGWPDLFVDYLNGKPQMLHNNRNGTFTNVAAEIGVDGPTTGFACWSFDYDNDGWPDLFATSYQRDLDNLALDLQGKAKNTAYDTTRIFRNDGGKRFRDVSAELGVNGMYAAMGANFGDFDNDGYLDFFLGTGDPSLQTLVPNRMFRNQAGKRFADISTTAGVAHLQKGHGVACGDWDRDGNVDMFVEIGGATPGDRFHSALYQNPGHSNAWLTVKLTGKKTNRAAFGACIKAVCAQSPRAVHRTVGYGSSFGGNPLEQTLGLGSNTEIETLEITWPTSGTKQVFHHVPARHCIAIEEFADSYRTVDRKRVPAPRPTPEPRQSSTPRPVQVGAARR